MTRNPKRQKPKGAKVEVKIESGTPSTVKYPAFEARRKKIFGSRVLPGSALVIQERGRY
jgi:hypothetical protein